MHFFSSILPFTIVATPAESYPLYSNLFKDVGEDDDAVRQSQQIPLAVAVCHALQERNASSNVVAGPFACDARHLVNQGGIPTVIFGPGTISEAHKPNEHIVVGEFLECIEHLIAFIAGWCNETPDRVFKDAAKEALSS